MQVVKRFVFLLLCLPLVVILASGLLLVAVSLVSLSPLADFFYPAEAEWSA